MEFLFIYLHILKDNVKGYNKTSKEGDLRKAVLRSNEGKKFIDEI